MALKEGYQAKDGQLMIYRATTPTLVDTECLTFQSDASGNLKVTLAGATGASATQVQGPAADNAAAVGNPVRTGAKYNLSTQTYADGDIADNQADVNGNLKVTQATLLAGEDLANDVQKVEQRFSLLNCTADTLVKTGVGFLHSVTFAQTDAAPTAGTIVIYDNTAESGTIIQTVSFTTAVFQPYTLIYDGVFSAGLYIGFTTTNDVNVTVSYR